MMQLSFCDLKSKEVVNLKDGARLGRVDDLCIEEKDATVRALVIFGRLKCFGLLGREDDLTICWDEIEMIGEDTILVCPKHQLHPKQKRNLIKKLFS